VCAGGMVHGHPLQADSTRNQWMDVVGRVHCVPTCGLSCVCTWCAMPIQTTAWMDSRTEDVQKPPHSLNG